MIQVLIKYARFHSIGHSSLEEQNQQNEYKLKVDLFN